ncbi:MAG: hypothetical protein AB7F59_02985 [Bdellovibrionales bacterium]
MRWLLLTFLYLSIAQAHATPLSCGGLSGEDYSRFFRNSSTLATKKTYIPNMLEVEAYFKEWLLSENTSQTFKEMFFQLHHLAANGSSGRSTYRPPKSPPNMRIGEKRQVAPVHLIFDQTVIKEILKLTSLEWRTDRDAIYRIKLREPPPVLPTFFARGEKPNRVGQIEMVHAMDHELEAIHSKMSHLLSEIRLDLQQKKPTRTVLEKLAYYYQLGCFAHTFERINNSILMAQVNVVLSLLSITPIPHGNMDMIMRSVDTDKATEYFFQQIEHVNGPIK